MVLWEFWESLEGVFGGNRGRKYASTGEDPNHVWALDFIGERLSIGRPYRVLNVIDEYTRRGLASIVDTIGARRVQQELEQLFKLYGRPVIIRTDNGTEFVAETLTEWLVEQGVDARPVEEQFARCGSPRRFCRPSIGRRPRRWPEWSQLTLRAPVAVVLSRLAPVAAT